ncbi:hypothetical protein [Glutamicibacter sp. AOP33-2CA-4]|uniref:hypothetical protein n=1 Tax=Glutamicibacter sp. AOP33-2CA-4 TaxID=3457690 RepID=UPI004033AFF3
MPQKGETIPSGATPDAVMMRVQIAASAAPGGRAVKHILHRSLHGRKQGHARDSDDQLGRHRRKKLQKCLAEQPEEDEKRAA